MERVTETNGAVTTCVFNNPSFHFDSEEVKEKQVEKHVELCGFSLLLLFCIIIQSCQILLCIYVLISCM